MQLHLHILSERGTCLCLPSCRDVMWMCVHRVVVSSHAAPVFLSCVSPVLCVCTPFMLLLLLWSCFCCCSCSADALVGNRLGAFRIVSILRNHYGQAGGQVMQGTHSHTHGMDQETACHAMAVGWRGMAGSGRGRRMYTGMYHV